MQGRYLNLSASAKDYVFNIENIPCNVTLLTENDISCYLQSFVSGRVPIDLFVSIITKYVHKNFSTTAFDSEDENYSPARYIYLHLHVYLNKQIYYKLNYDSNQNF